MTDSPRAPLFSGATPEERLAIATFYQAFSGDVSLLDQAVA